MKLVGLLGGHPLEPRRQRLVLRQPPGRHEVPPEYRVRRRPADAGARGELVPDGPPGVVPKILAARDGRRGEQPRLVGMPEPPVLLRVPRRYAVQDPSDASALVISHHPPP